MTKIAVIDKEKCKPTQCNSECKKYCPVEKKEKDSCITIEEKASIDEETCIGCGICQKRCPFNAIKIVNLPAIDERTLVHRYNKNGFALYNLPTPREGSLLGLLGKNGIGKSTAIRLLGNQERINLGKEKATDLEIKKFFQGTETLKYLEEIGRKKVAYKPQNISRLIINVKALDLLKEIKDDEDGIQRLSEMLNIKEVLEKNLNKLSGGELQKVAILAACLKECDTYFFDEPLAYLDIAERIRISEFIKNLTKEKTAVVIEHDLLILDYITDYINIFFGEQGAFGVTSNIRASRNAVNTYLSGYLKEENIRIRPKEIEFNFTKSQEISGEKIASWPDFEKSFKEGFSLKVKKGDIHKNQIIGVLGRNATGKTTFVRCLAGEEKVNIEGRQETLNLNMKIAHKPQHLQSDSEKMVKEITSEEKISKKMKISFNLDSIETKRLKNLSGGELQRLSIARCLNQDKDIYLLDEPSAYLDIEERISISKKIKEIISEKEKTAFIVDHDMLLISYLTNSILNFEKETENKAKTGDISDFKEGISTLLKELDITLRKDPESKRPRINKKGSVLDRQQKEKGEWIQF